MKRTNGIGKAAYLAWVKANRYKLAIIGAWEDLPPGYQFAWVKAAQAAIKAAKK